MAYSESLFTALASWALYLIIREQWIAAGALACLAGLTRATGLAVVVALWVACAQSIRRSRSIPGPVAAAMTVAPAGRALYALWVGNRVGNILGYLHVQKDWGNGLDGGIAFSEFIGNLLWSPSFLAGLALIGLVALLVHLCYRGFTMGLPLAVQVYTGVVVLLALCTSSYFGSKPRLLIPAFGLLVPAAILLTGLKPARAAAVIGPLILLSAAYGAFWLNGSGPP